MASPESPLVSAVIPTHGRPELVVRAIDSALDQTLDDLEVIVVVDGPDPMTEAVLAERRDDRLRVVVNPESVGASGARNVGAAEARGRWVAFLDDDDTWLPTKLARQLEAMTASGLPDPIGSCAIIVRTPQGDRAWRDRSPAPEEPIGDYLFVRPSLRVGEGTVGTSTIVASADLLRRVSFDPTVRRYQDADWLLRAVAAGGRLVHLPERLSVWTAPTGDASITASHATDWRYALDWIDQRRDLVSPRAYAAFVLIRVAALAHAAGDRGAVQTLWRAAHRHGAPTWREELLFLGRWVVPGGLRRGLRRALASVRPDR
ncbi:MAG TPA: glycosyltransferase family 2 protein [Candidatus Saccharimonadales bacterium]|nr:glycosyltransferase family 2 protein [Candidatus Saccharimonadales bacterium]